ncbi:peptidylprolyl isomerase [Aggregatilinea sp.]|uniref:peptidylprolyl isomerase n=1 Tax=Aggregatilinea sp. TaxID=2806333 RepID=UPI002D1FA471|nr:peptidylprolyl isomerase [Aggregatilinea sp.]
MKFSRRLLSVLTAAVVIALPVSAVSYPAQSVHAQEGAQTPAEICDAATADLAEPEATQFDSAEDVLEDGVDYGAIFCTAQGPIYVDLFEDLAPVTVNNFVFLAQQGYYNNTTFHRVIPGFMAQAGDPTGTGSGGPGYTFEDETDNGLTFDSYGILAMANAGADTNGSQFFITYGPTDWLNGAHTIFGNVLQGMDVAELLTPRDPNSAPSYEGDALETVVIVDDPAAVTVTPDASPSVDHFQILLNAAVDGMQDVLPAVPEATGPLDLDGTAALWAGEGGDAAVEAARSDLEARGLVGTASVGFLMDECVDPETLPIWYLSYQIADFGAADAAQAVMADETWASQWTDLGVFETDASTVSLDGHLYTRPSDICGEGTFYRVEVPQGRYMIVVEVALADSAINADSSPNATEFVESVSAELVNAFLGVLDRGNAATTAE